MPSNENDQIVPLKYSKISFFLQSLPEDFVFAEDRLFAALFSKSYYFVFIKCFFKHIG